MSLYQKDFFIVLFLMIFVNGSLSYSNDITRVAENYKTYSEYVKNFSTFNFNNRSYYCVEFATLGREYSSGFLVLDESLKAVDNETIVAGVILANFLSKNKRSVESWKRISSVFGYLSRKYEKDEELSSHFTKLKKLSKNMSDCLYKVVHYSCANYTLRCISIEKEILKELKIAKDIFIRRYSTEGKEEKKALEQMSNIETSISTELDNLQKILDHYLIDTISRIRGKEMEDETRKMVFIFFAIVLGFIILIISLKKICSAKGSKRKKRI